jgi:catechol 2,3-dioxygenase
MIHLSRLGHLLILVADIQRSKDFYTRVLGFHVREEDPEHGGVFLGLGKHTHVIDLVPTTEAQARATHSDFASARGLGVHHFAFIVESQQALKDAYFALKDNGVEILNTMDHVSQQSIYFHDPDRNIVEIYWDRPDALEMFEKGRRDGDEKLTFER